MKIDSEQEHTTVESFGQRTSGEDWRGDEAFAGVLKLADGETATVRFRDSGERFDHPGYRPAVVFVVDVIDSDGSSTVERLYVRSRGLLRQIRELGHIAGTTVELCRKGDGLETEWTLTKVE